MAAAPNKPIYSEQELFSHIKEFFVDFKVTLNDIKNPSQLFVMEFYKRSLVEFDVDVDTVMQPQMCQTAILLHPEAYTDIIPIMNLVCAINSFGIFKPYQGFRLTDLVNPKPKRNLILMSAVMNFLIFCDIHLGSRHHKLNQVVEMKQERDNLLKMQNELKQAIQNKAIDRAQKEIQMEELKKEYESLLEEQSSIMKRKTECISMHENAKARLAVAEQNLRKAKQHEMEVLEELNKLKSQVVESPKQVIAEYQMLKKKAEEMREKREIMQNLIETKQQTSEKLRNELKVQKERNAKLKETIDLIHQTREAECELEKIKKKTAEIEGQDKEMSQEYKELEDTVAACKKKLKDLQTEVQLLENSVKAAGKENTGFKKTGNTEAAVLKKIEKLNQTIEEKKVAFHKLVNDNDAMYEKIVEKGKESDAAYMNKLDQIAEDFKIEKSHEQTN